jgi:hypothetical protein
MPEGKPHPQSPDPEVMAKSKTIVIDRLERILKSPPDDKSRNLSLLAEACNVSWPPACKNPALTQMRNINEYEKVRKLAPVPYKFPMEDGQPDFVFSDEENAVIAMKHGDTRLFMNLYFRAENAVNNIAKILEITPTLSRIVTAKINSQVIGTGEIHARPDDIDWIRGDAPYRTPPGPKIHQAWAGEELPVSVPPSGPATRTQGKFGYYVGRAAFY